MGGREEVGGEGWEEVGGREEVGGEGWEERGGRREVGGERWEERGMVITYSKENVISLSLLSSLSKHDFDKTCAIRAWPTVYLPLTRFI